MPNHLAQTTSPYLLQHANNPVDWYPWGEAALTRARAENKPIFLSIGYAACHWCHVMAHESFEEEATAAFLNEHFINIKVDREERPDLDGIYMAATVALTGQGGWPMSVFLTPDLRPFYAGTYFPPVARHQLPAFGDLLRGIVAAWQNEPGQIERVALQVSEHLQRQNQPPAGGVILNQSLLESAAQFLTQNYDWGFGGWGEAPKFPQPMSIEFLLRRGGASHPAALHALKTMARGGMYDVVGGGFSRYSTDAVWRVPHFEKMLYDNAQLARAYLRAWQVTGEPFYRRIAQETLDFIQRELSDPQGGFYSSLDADSEGEEGKFYTWQAAEIEKTLGADWDFFRTAYGVSPTGNWQGRTVLQRALDDATLAARFHLTEENVTLRLAECHRKLLAVRETRVRPGLDDKALTSWNGLALSVFAEAARAFLPGDFPGKRVKGLNSEAQVKGSGSEARAEGLNSEAQVKGSGSEARAEGLNSKAQVKGSGSEARTEILCSKYLDLATRSADFLLTRLRPQGRLRHAWRAGQTSSEVFLEDYAALILGLLDLYETDFNPRWFSAAQELTAEMLARFDDPQGGFFDTPADSPALLMRPKDLTDNATPSGNALAAEALLRLAAFTGQQEYRIRAEQSLTLAAESAARYSSAFARWLSAADFALAPVQQIAILGPLADEQTQALLRTARQYWSPNQVIACADLPLPPGSPPLLQERPLLNNRPTAYVCQGFVCKTPVTSAEALETLLNPRATAP